MTTPQVQLTEPIITALVNRLNSQLNTAIDTINAAVTDGYTIPYPAQTLDYIPPLQVLATYPTIGMQDVDSHFEDDIGMQATGKHRVVVCTFIATTDPRQLAWQLRRYAQAVTFTILAGRQLGIDNAWGVVLDQVKWGPTLNVTQDPQETVSWVATSIIAKRDEY